MKEGGRLTSPGPLLNLLLPFPVCRVMNDFFWAKTPALPRLEQATIQGKYKTPSQQILVRECSSITSALEALNARE